MAFVSTINILGSGMTAQQLRLDIISENVTNMNTTRTEAGGPYRRKVAVFQAVDGRDSFRNVLARTRSGLVSNAQGNATGGVQVVDIWEDTTDFKLKYDPSDPDANDEGYGNYELAARQMREHLNESLTFALHQTSKTSTR